MITDISISDDGFARVPDGLGGTKTVSLKSLGEELIRMDTNSDGKKTFSSFRLPSNTVSFGTDGVSATLVMYFPKCKTDLKYTGGRKLYKNCAFPAVMIIVELSRRSDNRESRWVISNVLWFGTDYTEEQIPVYKDKQSYQGHLFDLPFPNQFGEGRMCTGGSSYRTSYQTNWMGMTELYHHVLIGSSFNNDLGLKAKFNGTIEKYFGVLTKLEEFPNGFFRGHPDPIPEVSND